MGGSISQMFIHMCQTQECVIKVNYIRVNCVYHVYIKPAGCPQPATRANNHITS